MLYLLASVFLFVCMCAYVHMCVHMFIYVHIKHLINLPGYGTRPKVTISYNKMPNDQTSDFVLNLR